MGWLSRNKRPSATESAPSESAEPSVSAQVPIPPTAPPEQVPVRTPEAEQVPVRTSEPEQVPVRTPEPEPIPVRTTTESGSGATPAPPMGDHGPLVTVTRFESAATELEWQLPVTGELYRLMPGSDRPDYSLMVLDRPLHFYPAESFDIGRAPTGQRVEDRKGRPMVRVDALLLCARYVGQQLHPGMRDLAVNLAYVIDPSLAHDLAVDFGKIEFAAIGYLSEGRHEGAAADSGPASAATPGGAESAGGQSASAPEPDVVAPPADGVVPVGVPPLVVVDEVVPEVARLLKEGIEQERGRRVERLTAVLTLDERHRISGLSGNADGQPPAPTSETFERINEALAPLADLPAHEAIAKLTIRLDGDRLSSDVDYRGI